MIGYPEVFGDWKTECIVANRLLVTVKSMSKLSASFSIMRNFRTHSTIYYINNILRIEVKIGGLIGNSERGRKRGKPWEL